MMLEYIETRLTRALRVYLLFQLWTFSLCKHCKIKTNKKFADFIKTNFVDFQNFQKSNFVRGKFLKFWSSITFPGVMWGPTKMWAPLGSAVLTFIGYKQTVTQTSKVYIKIILLQYCCALLYYKSRTDTLFVAIHWI